MKEEILKDYTQEEIEELALRQLESSDYGVELSLKIEKIDKEYSKNNRKAVAKAITNGSIILMCTIIVLNSNSNLANFGTKDLSGIFEQSRSILESLPESEMALQMYTFMFTGLQAIINKIGLIGIILATKSIKFILTTMKDAKKSIELKKELKDLEEKIEKYERKK